MTNNDKTLIEKALKMKPSEWSLVDKLIEEADSKETINCLRGISSSLYHREEAAAGLL